MAGELRRTWHAWSPLLMLLLLPAVCTSDLDFGVRGDEPVGAGAAEAAHELLRRGTGQHTGEESRTAVPSELSGA